MSVGIVNTLPFICHNFQKTCPEMERSHLDPYYDQYDDVALTQYYNVDFVAVQTSKSVTLLVFTMQRAFVYSVCNT